MVEIVTTDAEALALSERYDNNIRVEAVAGELIYVLVPDPEQAPTEHIGTLRGAYLEGTLDKLSDRLQELNTGAIRIPTTADVSVRDEEECDRAFCIIAWQCQALDANCRAAWYSSVCR